MPVLVDPADQEDIVIDGQPNHQRGRADRDEPVDAVDAEHELVEPDRRA